VADLKGSQTHENLRQLFALEAQAHVRALYFAKIAEFEGHPETARILREAAEALRLHSDGHLDFLREVGDPLNDLPLGETASNREAHLATEQELVERLGTEMARTARGEGFPAIASWLETLGHVKQAHAAVLAGECE
jgi:rubrerythrin